MGRLTWLEAAILGTQSAIAIGRASLLMQASETRAGHLAWHLQCVPKLSCLCIVALLSLQSEHHTKLVVQHSNCVFSSGTVLGATPM